MRKIKNVIFVLGSIGLVVSLPLFIYLLANKSASSKIKAYQEKRAILFIWPAESKVKTNEKVTLQVKINTRGQQTAGGKVTLNFDPNFLTFFRVNPDSQATQVEEANETGKIEVSLSKKVTGEETLFEAIFSAKKIGETKVEFGQETFIPSAGGVMDTVAAKKGAVVKIES